MKNSRELEKSIAERKVADVQRELEKRSMEGEVDRFKKQMDKLNEKYQVRFFLLVHEKLIASLFTIVCIGG